MTKIKYISRRRGRFYVLFVDFQKAFDSIVHEKLFQVPFEKDLKGKVFNVLLFKPMIMSSGR